jgi:hypothetical protein
LKKTKKILILQPDLDQAQAIAKFLKKYSRNFFIIGGITHDFPAKRSIPFFDQLEEISQNSEFDTEKYDIILPTGAMSTFSFIKKIKTIQIGNIPFSQKNLYVFKKLPMLDAMNELHIPVPYTYHENEVIDEFPVFYKQRRETGSGIKGVIKNRQDLESLRQEKTIFFQEYIDSPNTYGIGFLAKEGILLTSFIQNEVLSNPKTGGDGVILQACDDKKLIDYSKKILKKLNYSGWGLIEFKYCPKRMDYVFMELNAKFWASIEFAFLNNPVFMKELFDIQYNSSEVKCIVFLDRLAIGGVKEYLQFLISHIFCYKLHFLKSVKILLGMYLPQWLKKILL